MTKIRSQNSKIISEHHLKVPNKDVKMKRENLKPTLTKSENNINFKDF